MLRTLGIALALIAPSAFAVDGVQSRYNLAPPVTPLAEDIYSLHHYVMGICVAIFLFVFAWMFIAILRHRKSLGHKPANFHENTTVEIIWTVIPFLIVVAIAVPATRIVVAMKDTSSADLTIKATGYQWKWGYEYLRGEGEGIALLSTLATPRGQLQLASLGSERDSNPNYLLEVDQPLVVPVDAKVRIITTASDVIHSWFVPAFAVKQDAIPGFVRDTWFRATTVGTFRGQCAELCGKEHAYMPIVVRVLSREDYAAWVVAKKRELQALADDPAKVWQLGELTARGKTVFESNCAACHQAGGTGNAAIGAPALIASPVVTAAPAEQIGVLLHGRNNRMPAWQQLSDVEIASVITYTKHAWGNSVDQIVQPRDIAAARAAR
ncbi:cytochrome c oxidase subunit II [Derxia lacustris]|uniref:cytochrome c oxidase subunit II n=1 Tax=Derxia lacustris TaxID=764842 RepID=UPI000A175FB2|nr:cytochrome c oxidase subunit II [Derxia lacustris]